MEWYTVDSGGDASSGGTFAVQGTLGQTDANPLQPAEGGAFELASGYWSIVPTPPVDALFADGFESP